MEKAVVRRGIGAVVLALVAALLLGYLLKGKAPERKEVVNMELPKSPIQIFPEGEGAGTVANSGGNAGSADASKSGGAGIIAATGAGAVAAGSGAVAAVKGGAKDAGAAVADSGKKLVGATTGTKTASAKDLPVDAKTGNPTLTKSNVVVDGSGQAIYGAKTAGVKNTPANFEFRSAGKKEVRPSIDGRLTSKSGSKTANTKKAPAKSNARLVGEKKLAPVGSRSNKSSKSRKVASSRNKAVIVKKKVAKTSTKKKVVKKTVVKKSTAAPAGRNKYVVQLLATSNKSKANGLKATMSREGYPAYVTRTTRAGKALYRVRVGSYSGKSSAIKKQASMKRRYRKNTYVQSSIVVRN